MRQLPAVDQVLSSPAGKDLSGRYGHSLTVAAIRSVVESKRSAINSGKSKSTDVHVVVEEVSKWLGKIVEPSPQGLINATGVIIHTNLGRAPLSRRAIQEMVDAASGYSNLEYDLDSGQRGTRTVHAAKLLTQITGAEAALVVNNNAAAVFLMLTALCQGKEVIISRGQLVEIGGGFRIPEIMAQSGAKLVEVGTTNQTHLRDYKQAINDETAAILMVHHSNYQIIGFSGEPRLAQLAELAKGRHISMLYDQGSGALIDTASFGLEHEPTIAEAIADGADLVSFSGDKLLGGPQAGILCGRETLVNRLKGHPLARAVRADKLCLAGLTVTLAAYATDRGGSEVPIWQMIGRDLGSIYDSASEIAEALRHEKLEVRVIEGDSTVGGGSLPGTTIPTWLVAISLPNAASFVAQLRENKPPIVSRIADDRVIFDPRTILPGQRKVVIKAILKIAANS